MKILLGGIPLGCDNIGDEAILACVVRMLREDFPGAEISVATADPDTAALLGVRVFPAYGFAGTPPDGFDAAVRGHDAYIWCGATGLSDYPHVALDLLERAQKNGVPSFVWGVGMDDVLNPAFFKASGKRGFVLRALGLAGVYERRLQKALARRIASVLPRCAGVWLRDPQSAAVLSRFGFSGAEVCGDTAILLRPEPHEDGKSAPAAGAAPALGICISAQRRVADLDGVKELVRRVRAAGALVRGIPMNRKTDLPLMESLGIECVPAAAPRETLAAAAGCAAVVSSRLHLLILAANAGTFPMGVSRGSKVANWLANFGLKPSGAVDRCDWSALADCALAALRGEGAKEWRAARAAAYAAMDARLGAARKELARRLSALPRR